MMMDGIGLILCLAAAQDWPQHQNDAKRSGYAALDVPGPHRITWRWHPADSKVTVSGKVQPVVAGGVVCVGYTNGVMYGLNSRTGAQVWSYAAGGSITHSASMDSGRVYFGSTNGTLHCLNASNGQPVWSAKTGGPIHVAPLVFAGRAIAGSTDGILYAFDAASGAPSWTYDSGAPILTPAAGAGSTVYSGNEKCQAFAVSATTGAETWKVQLQGQSLSVHPPVVSTGANVAFYRTGPFNVFHEILGQGDTLLANGAAGGWNSGDGTAAQVTAEQDRIVSDLNANAAWRKTFWALNTSNGTEKYTVPVLYTCGEGTVPVPPVVDDAGGRAWVVWRSLYARWDSGSIVRAYGAEPGKLDLTTGRIAHFSTEARASGQRGRFHAIGDETIILSAGGNRLWASSRGTLGGLDLGTEDAFHACASFQNGDDYANGGPPYAYGGAWPEGSIEAGGGNGGGYGAGPAIADGGVFWFARWGLLVRIDRQ
jgi:hypothetical protein